MGQGILVSYMTATYIFYALQVAENVSCLKVGDRCGLPWFASGCGKCEYCVGGWETLCIYQENRGFTVNGCLQEYVAVKVE